MLTVNRFDAYLGQLFSYPLAVWRHLTGKGGLSLARLLTPIGYAVIIATNMRDYASGDGQDLWWVALMTGLYLWMLLFSMRAYAELENIQGSEVLQIPPRYPTIATWRQVVVIFQVIFFWSIDLQDIGSWLLVLAMYAAADTLPPPKSIFARAKAALERLADSLLPRPVPIPIGGSS